MKRYLVGFSCIYLIAGSVSAAQIQNTSYVLCHNKGLARTLRVVVRPEGCVTLYTKLGTDRVVASGHYTASCLAVLENIKGNLEEAGWKCRDISQSQVTQSYEIKEE